MTVFPPGVQRRAFHWSRGQLNPFVDFDDAMLPEGLRTLVETHTALFHRWLGAKAAEKQAHDNIAHAEEADRQARAEALRKRKEPPAPTRPQAEDRAAAARQAREDLGLAGAKVEQEIIDLVSQNEEWAAVISARLDQQDAAVSAALDLIADTIKGRGRLRWCLDIATGAKSLDRHGPVDIEAGAAMAAIRGSLAEVEIDPISAIEKSMVL